jgi:hypothetical protein
MQHEVYRSMLGNLAALSHGGKSEKCSGRACRGKENHERIPRQRNRHLKGGDEPVCFRPD